MHTKALAALFGLSLVACTGVIDGGTGGGDDEPGPGEACGDGVVQSGEGCDDGNMVSGDGCSASCSEEAQAMPRMTASVDKPTVATENGKEEIVKLTIVSIEGFTGNVGVTPTFVDAANAPIPGVTVTGPTSITVAANATVPSDFKVTFPSNTTGSTLVGTLKLDLTAPTGAQTITSAITIEGVYTIATPANAGTSPATHPWTNKTITVKRGTKVRILNSDGQVHITHGGGEWPHEGTDPGANGQPGAAYEIETIGSPPGSSGTVGCHTHGDATYGTLVTE